MKYLRKFNESVFDGDWLDYKKITDTDFYEIYYNNRNLFVDPIDLQKYNIKSIIEEKVGEEVFVKLKTHFPKPILCFGWGTNRWTLFPNSKEPQLKDYIIDLHLLKDYWILFCYSYRDKSKVSSNKFYKEYYVCETIEGLKKLIGDLEIKK
jgi:hypothetical protein